VAHAETAPGYPLQVLAEFILTQEVLRAFRDYPLRKCRMTNGLVETFWRSFFNELGKI
jgi:hypothetical protein